MKTKINIGLGVLVTCLIIISYGFKNNNTVNIVKITIMKKKVLIGVVNLHILWYGKQQ